MSDKFPPMRKPTEIVDFLLDRVKGLERRDLEARLKFLRAAGVYPPARRVGDRLAEGLTDRHCANLLIALLGSNAATRAAESVPQLADLPLLGKASTDETSYVVMPNNEPPHSFVHFLERAIREWREGTRPWSGEVDIDDIAVWHGPPWRALVTFMDIKPSEDGQLGWIISFGHPDEEQGASLRLTEHRSMHGYIIGVLAEWLRGEDAEDEAATA